MDDLSENTRASAPDLAPLCEALLALRDEREADRFLRDLLTPGEIRTLVERWRVARLLDEGGHSYREIAEMTGASTTTVTADVMTDVRSQGERADDAVAGLGHNASFFCVRLSPNGRLLAIAGYGGKMTLYDACTYFQLHEVQYTSMRGPPFIWSTDFSGDSRYLAVGNPTNF